MTAIIYFCKKFCHQVQKHDCGRYKKRKGGKKEKEKETALYKFSAYTQAVLQCDFCHSLEDISFYLWIWLNQVNCFGHQNIQTWHCRGWKVLHIGTCPSLATFGSSTSKISKRRAQPSLLEYNRDNAKGETTFHQRCGGGFPGASAPSKPSVTRQDQPSRTRSKAKWITIINGKRNKCPLF